jgi:hypothetical protein
MSHVTHKIRFSFFKDRVHTEVHTTGENLELNPVSINFYYGMSSANMQRQVFEFLNAHFAYVQELRKIKEAASLLTIMSQNEDISPKQAMSRLVEGESVWRKVMGIVYKYDMEDGVVYCSWIEDDKEKRAVSDMSIQNFMREKMKWYI